MPKINILMILGIDSMGDGYRLHVRGGSYDLAANELPADFVNNWRGYELVETLTATDTAAFNATVQVRRKGVSNG